MKKYAMGANPPTQYEWMLGKSVMEIDAIRLVSEETGQPIDVVLSTSSWRQKFSELESEYNKVVDEIALKIKAAALLLKESEKIAKGIGGSILNMQDKDYNSVIDPLFSEMNNIGWSTSSLEC